MIVNSFLFTLSKNIIEKFEVRIVDFIEVLTQIPVRHTKQVYAMVQHLMNDVLVDAKVVGCYRCHRMTGRVKGQVGDSN